MKGLFYISRQQNYNLFSFSIHTISLLQNSSSSVAWERTADWIFVFLGFNFPLITCASDQLYQSNFIAIFDSGIRILASANPQLYPIFYDYTTRLGPQSNLNRLQSLILRDNLRCPSYSKLSNGAVFRCRWMKYLLWMQNSLPQAWIVIKLFFKVNLKLWPIRR